MPMHAMVRAKSELLLSADERAIEFDRLLGAASQRRAGLFSSRLRPASQRLEIGTQMNSTGGCQKNADTVNANLSQYSFYASCKRVRDSDARKSAREA
jgi:hypothetical protein